MTNSRYAADIVAHSRGARAYSVHTQPQCEAKGYVWDTVNNCCIGQTCPAPTPPPATCPAGTTGTPPNCVCSNPYQVFDPATMMCKPKPTPPGPGYPPHPRPDYPPVSRCKSEYGGSCDSECRGWGGYRCEQCVKACGPPNCGRYSEWDWRNKRCRECSPWEDWYGGRCNHKFPGKPRYPTYWPPHIVNVEPPDVTVNVEEKADAEAAGGAPAFLTGECMPGVPIPCGLLALGVVGGIVMVAMVAIGRK